MLETVHHRVQVLQRAGKPEREVIDAPPTAQFDKKWAPGYATAAEFVSSIYPML